MTSDERPPSFWLLCCLVLGEVTLLHVAISLSRWVPRLFIACPSTFQRRETTKPKVIGLVRNDHFEGFSYRNRHCITAHLIALADQPPTRNTFNCREDPAC